VQPINAVKLGNPPFGIHPPGFVAVVVALTFGLAASNFFPVIFLDVFNKRSNRERAIAGMICAHSTPG
jgi:cation/acetate symporter